MYYMIVYWFILYYIGHWIYACYSITSACNIKICSLAIQHNSTSRHLSIFCLYAVTVFQRHQEKNSTKTKKNLFPCDALVFRVKLNPIIHLDGTDTIGRVCIHLAQMVKKSPGHEVSLVGTA